MKNLKYLPFLFLLALSACTSKDADISPEVSTPVVEQQVTPPEKFAEGTKIEVLDTSVQVTEATGTVQVSESTVGGTPRLPPQ